MIWTFKKILLIILSMMLFFPTLAASTVDGAEVYQEKCSACHDEGKAGAPALDNKASWHSRLEKGLDKLIINTLNPDAHVTCRDCSHRQVKEAVKYMAAKADGGNRTLW